MCNLKVLILTMHLLSYLHSVRVERLTVLFLVKAVQIASQEVDIVSVHHDQREAMPIVL